MDSCDLSELSEVWVFYHDITVLEPLNSIANLLIKHTCVMTLN